MSNGNWVCFDCRATVRRPARAAAVKCLRCGRACRYLGKSIAVPRRGNDAAWRALKRRVTAAALAFADGQIVEAERRRRYLEKRIPELESQPASAYVSRRIQELRDEFTRLREGAG